MQKPPHHVVKDYMIMEEEDPLDMYEFQSDSAPLETFYMDYQPTFFQKTTTF